MNTHTKQLGLRSFALILVIATLLLGGIGITGAAAQSAIPGDALYPVKTSIEQTRLSLAQDAGDRAQMKLRFAEVRLEEIAALIKEGRFREIREAVLAFESDIHSALLELETLSQIDPSRSARIALEITSALTRYAQALSVMAANAPESVRLEVTRALDTTQIAGNLELPPAALGIEDNSNADDGNFNSNGDDNLNSNEDGVNANLNENDDNINFNGDDDNANLNGDDDNANFNGDDQGNHNGNDGNTNLNGDDDSNHNGGDDNSNISNGNDDNGQNRNANQNSNDDSNSNGGGSGGGHDDNSNDSGRGGNGNDSGRGGNGNDSGGGGHGGNGNDD